MLFLSFRGQGLFGHAKNKLTRRGAAQNDRRKPGFLGESRASSYYLTNFNIPPSRKDRSPHHNQTNFPSSRYEPSRGPLSRDRYAFSSVLPSVRVCACCHHARCHLYSRVVPRTMQLFVSVIACNAPCAFVGFCGMPNTSNIDLHFIGPLMMSSYRRGEGDDMIYVCFSAGVSLHSHDKTSRKAYIQAFHLH